jgi:uncharacterized protein (DUF952 family)
LPWADYDAWRARGEHAAHRPASWAREGFVHLSFAHQLASTLRVHFGRAGELALLELDRARLSAKLVLEPARGGELFPHLYRELEPADVLHAFKLEPGEGHRLPPGLVPGGQGAPESKGPAAP